MFAEGNGSNQSVWSAPNCVAQHLINSSSFLGSLLLGLLLNFPLSLSFAVLLFLFLPLFLHLKLLLHLLFIFFFLCSQLSIFFELLSSFRLFTLFLLLFFLDHQTHVLLHLPVVFLLISEPLFFPCIVLVKPVRRCWISSIYWLFTRSRDNTAVLSTFAWEACFPQ